MSLRSLLLMFQNNHSNLKRLILCSWTLSLPGADWGHTYPHETSTAWRMTGFSFSSSILDLHTSHRRIWRNLRVPLPASYRSPHRYAKGSFRTATMRRFRMRGTRRRLSACHWIRALHPVSITEDKTSMGVAFHWFPIAGVIPLAWGM